MLVIFYFVAKGISCKVGNQIVLLISPLSVVAEPLYVGLVSKKVGKRLDEGDPRSKGNTYKIGIKSFSISFQGTSSLRIFSVPLGGIINPLFFGSFQTIY